MRSAMRALCHQTVVLVASAGFPALATAQVPPEPLWVRQIGASIYDRPESLVTHGSGMYVCGRTYGSYGGPYQGLADAFVASLSSEGQVVWVRQVGTAASDFIGGAVLDEAGGVILGGYADPDAWLTRFNSAGDQLWYRRPLLAYPGAHINGMATDGVGGLFIGGRTANSNVIVARIDHNGVAGWTAVFGSTRTDSAHALAPDGTGGFFISGTTNGWLGGMPVGFDDAWLARYDGNGNQLWLIQWGDPVGGAEGAYYLVPDGSGGVYIAGVTGGPGSTARFLARHDADGNRLWKRILYGWDIDIRGLAPDKKGGVFVGGKRLRELVGVDDFLSRYDSDGELMWMRRSSPQFRIQGFALAPDGAGGVYFAGRTEGNISGANPPPPLSSSVFVARFPPGERMCYPNCDGSTVEPRLNIDDLVCFVSQFAQARAMHWADKRSHYVNCDEGTTEPVLNVDDFICFINRFAQGCP